MNQLKQRHRNTGHTLPELMISLVVASMLMTGLFATLLIASQSLNPSMASNAVSNAADATTQILSELQLAVGFTERRTHAVTFTLVDRNGDANPASVRYAWSGAAGDPLTRQYKGGVVRTILPSVNQFQLRYDMMTTVDPPPNPATVHYFVRMVGLIIQPTDQAATRIDSATEVRDRPEVATP